VLGTATVTADLLIQVDPGTRAALLDRALEPFCSGVRIPEFDAAWPADRQREWLRVAAVVDREHTQVKPADLAEAILQRRTAEARLAAAVAEFHVKTAGMAETGGRPALYNPDSVLNSGPEGVIPPWDSRYVDRRAVEPTGATLRRQRETLGWTVGRCGKIGGIGGPLYRGIEAGTEDRLGTRAVLYRMMGEELKRRGIEFD
jgi:hypothetical protein